MRILIVNKYMEVTGGADRHCLGLARGLRAEGQDVAFLALNTTETSEPGAFVPATVRHGTRRMLSVGDATRVAARGFWNRTASAAMGRMIDEFRPDVVHVHKLYPQLSVAPVVVAARARVPVVQTVHDYEFISASPFDHEGGRFDRGSERLDYRVLTSALFWVKSRLHVPNVIEWISVSNATAERYRQKGFTMTVLPNFVDRGADPARLRSFDERRGILFVGRLTPEKGVGDLLQVARRAPDLPVMIAGDGPMRPVVEEASGSCENVSYLGALTAGDVLDVMARARVIALPSRWQEPGPLVALEAMSQGTPVVAYECGGLAEYVANASAGTIVETREEALLPACRQLHDDRDVWLPRSRGGASASVTTHSLDTYIARLMEVYGRAIRRGFRSKAVSDPLQSTP